MSRSRDFTEEYKMKKEKDSTLSYTTDDISLVPLRRTRELNFSIYLSVAIIK